MWRSLQAKFLLCVIPLFVLVSTVGLSWLAEYDMPVFARAVTPAGPYKNGPGLLGEPIALGGVVVRPGDIVVGDADGVVVVPLHRATEIADGAEAKRASEDATRTEIEAALQPLPGRPEPDQEPAR